MTRPPHGRQRPHNDDEYEDAPRPQQPRRRRASWPYAVALVAAWGLIFGAVFFSRF